MPPMKVVRFAEEHTDEDYDDEQYHHCVGKMKTSLDSELDLCMEKFNVATVFKEILTSFLF